MANLALNKGALTGIWVGLILLAAAVFTAGFLMGRQWPVQEGAPPVASAVRNNFDRAVVETPQEPASPESTSKTEAASRPAAKPESSETETETGPSPAKKPLASAEEPTKVEEPAEIPKTAPASSQDKAEIEAESEPETKAAAAQAEPEKPVAEPEESPTEPAASPEPISEPEPEQAAQASGTVFYVQVASFRSLDRAAVMRSDLLGMGLSPEVIRVFDSNNQPWYVVHIGDYRSREQAEQAGRNYEQASGSSYTVREFDAGLLRERRIPPEDLPTETE